MDEKDWGLAPSQAPVKKCPSALAPLHEEDDMGRSEQWIVFRMEPSP